MRIFLLLFAMIFSLASLNGCERKATTASEAISRSQSMQSVNQKVDYLVGQANMFIDSRQYAEASKIAGYILTDVDKNSQQARDILQKAQEQMTQKAGETIGNMQQSFGDVLGNKSP